MKMIRVIKAKQLNDESILKCKNLEELLNLIGKTTEDIKVVARRKFYDYPNDTWYYKNTELAEERFNELPLTNRIISNIDRSIKEWQKYKLTLPKKQRHADYVKFENNILDIRSTGGSFYKLYFNDPIKTKHKITYY